MSDEQIKSMMDSYFIKSRLISAFQSIVLGIGMLLICIFLLTILNINIISVILTFGCIFLLSFSILERMLSSIKLKQFSKINAVLDDECDFLTFKKLVECGYKDYNSPAYAKSIIIISYIRICELEKNSEKIKELMNDKVFIRFNKNNKIYLEFLIFLIAIIEKNDKQLESSYHQLIELMKRKKGMKLNHLKNDIIAYYASYKDNYEVVLDIMENVNLKTNISQVLIAFNKGLSLYKLERNDEAIERLNYVIEHGNTLPQVERAKELLLEISE
jgi:tetratricopeptide (TPR) repeat protein